MASPTPKPAKLRQRRNRASTASNLMDANSLKKRRAPNLPNDREWHKQTKDWWRDIWRSPMAAEFLQSDIHGLYILAALINRYWTIPSTALAAEIRLQRQCFGLTPIDRRRLQWEVERAENAGARRLPSRETPSGNGDPRRMLEVVS